MFESTWRINITQHNNKKWEQRKGYKVTINIKWQSSRTFSKWSKNEARKNAFRYIFDTVLDNFEKNDNA